MIVEKIQQLTNFESLKSFFSREDTYVFSIFFLANIVILLNSLSQFKFMFIFYLVIFLLQYVRLKSFFLSSFLVFIFTMPIFRPAKTYIVSVIQGKDLLLPGLKGGYFLGYGVTFSLIFSVITSFFILRYFLTDNKLSKVFALKKIKLTFFSMLVFFLIGVFSSYEHSPFLHLSLVWLVQYMSYAIVAFGVLLLYLHKKIDLLLTTLLASFSFQFIVVLLQFLRQRSIGLAVEFNFYLSQLFTGLDEANTFFRVLGTFMYHNQLALVTGIFFVFFFIYGVYQKSKTTQLVIFLAMVLSLLVIILTQTRSIWICMPIIFAIAMYFIPEKISIYKKYYKKINRNLLHLLYVFLLLIIIPRFINSFNSTQWGSGVAIRQAMIHEGITVLQESVLFGYGIATNEHILFSNFPLGVMSVFPAAIHMAYLQLLLEVGLIGFTAFMFPFILILRTILVEKIYNLYSLTYLCGIVIVAVYYLLQPHVLILEGQYIGLVLGMGLIAISYENKKNLN